MSAEHTPRPWSIKGPASGDYAILAKRDIIAQTYERVGLAKHEPTEEKARDGEFTSVDVLAQYRAIIISGGPESVFGPTAPKYDLKLFELDTPILGICYGLQLLNYIAGGTVESKVIREDGQFDISIETGSKLFQGLQEQHEARAPAD